MTNSAKSVSGSDPDKLVVQCNFREGTSECSVGARAYVIATDRVGRRIRLLARSRSGRWIFKWENHKRLHHFRYKTIPPEHPLYCELYDTFIMPEGLGDLNTLDWR